MSSKSGIEVEICDCQFGTYTGSIMYKGKKAGHIQLNFGFKPKRVSNLINKMREVGIKFNFPQYAPEGGYHRGK